ncbi:bromodomain-containing protein DDB_G0270170-like [Plutella xylostella]|uniref:bromodomain-containing protein DDB_G0270170-like n=1 Tax=Plutella xylostella TaxID=51655 RepID=UPI0020322FB5|nr:bromodomain-containing protein DDB_G0270170-like [Plutella xylostella]
MWRASYYNEDWERRKTYLLRSYFEDIPRLTTIFERGESSESSSDLPYRPPRYYDRHTHTVRPESPLPDLIIEKERKRNVHDEPEEFYQRLEIKVKRYIKKLNENKTSSNEYDTDLCSTVIIDNEIRSSLMEGSNNINGDNDIRQITSDDVESKSGSIILQTRARIYNKNVLELENSNSQCESEIEIVSQKSITDEETNESINNAVESNNDTEENNNYHSEAENAKNISTNSNKSIETLLF